MARIVIIIMTLLSSVYCEQQEIKLIAELNDFFDFDHNIFLLDSEVDINGFINTRDFTPRSVFVVKKGDHSEKSRVVQITNNPFMIVVPATTVFDNYYHLMRKALVNTNRNTKIGIFFTEFSSADVLQKLFQWCKESQLFNVFVTVYARNSTEKLLNMFTFHPFRTISLINVTSSSFKMYFASVNSNFHRHRLVVSVYGEIKLWDHVLSLMNATYNGSIFDGPIDVMRATFAIQGLTEMYPLYPVKIFSTIIVVPEAEPYAGFSAYLRTATSDEFFGYSLLTIAAVMLLLIIFRYMKQKKILFFKSVSDVMNLLMNDNGYIKYQRLSHIEVYLIVPLTFVGLVVVNGILSNLQSYLTRPVYQPQIKTLEDIYRSKFRIETFHSDWKDYLINLLHDKTIFDWKDKVTVTAKFEKNLYSFNTSAAYLTDASKAKSLLRAQKRFDIRGYYIIETFSMPLFFTYFVGHQFVFTDRTNEIIHRMQSAGLIQFWQKEFDGRSDKTLADTFKLRPKVKTSDVDELEFPIFIAYGWLASIIAFVMEIIYKNFSKFLRMKLRHKLSNINTTAAVATISIQQLNEIDDKAIKQQKRKKNGKKNEIKKEDIEENEIDHDKIQKKTLTSLTPKLPSTENNKNADEKDATDTDEMVKNEKASKDFSKKINSKSIFKKPGNITKFFTACEKAKRELIEPIEQIDTHNNNDLGLDNEDESMATTINIEGKSIMNIEYSSALAIKKSY